MTADTQPTLRILGTVRAVDGNGAVRIEDRFDTDIDDLWSALTDPARLARWYGEVEGELRLGGEFHARLYATGWEGTGTVAVCEPPRRLALVSRDPDEPSDDITEVTLTPDGEGTILVLEQRGMPLVNVAGYGAGNQLHVEDLGDYIAGRERRTNVEERFQALMPAYREQAAQVKSED